MKKMLVGLTVGLAAILVWPSQTQAAPPAIGIHLLDPNELGQAVKLAEGSTQIEGAVTVVLRSDERNSEKWQKFLTQAAENHILPIVRLATEMTAAGWRKPVKKDIVEHAKFLSFLDWRRDNLVVVAFNEPNHQAEWGGQLNPEEYAEILDFTINWFHTERKNYQVLPAGLDAAAPNGPTTMDSKNFIDRMLARRPELTEKIDGWTTHAYANPGFTGSPDDQGKSSIRGFEHELAWLADHTERKFDVYITEAGWKQTAANREMIGDNYRYALEKVWNDERIKAVTPFVFSAQLGPFVDFSFTTPGGGATPQYEALKAVKARQKT